MPVLDNLTKWQKNKSSILSLHLPVPPTLDSFIFLSLSVELVLFCRASPLQNVLYQHLLRSKAVSLCLQSRGCQQQLSGSAHLTIIGALKQLCNHPRLIYNKAVQAQQTSPGVMLAGSEARQSDRHSWKLREENGAEVKL